MTRLKLGPNCLLLGIYLFFASGVFTRFLQGAESTASPSKSAASNPIASRKAVQPFLWKVEGPRPSWLFGTIHSGDPLVAALPASVTTALDSSQSFHPEVELSADLGMALAGKILNGNAPDLSTRLAPALWARVKKAGAAMGLPDMMLQRLTPGLAALFFSAPAETDVNATVDGQVYQRALTHKLKIAALETLDEQLSIFTSLPEAQAIVALTEALDEAEQGRPNEKKLLRAYAGGDEKAVVDAVEEEFASSPGAKGLAEPLLYRRNRVMADRLAPHLKAGGAFVAIGTAHLTGPKSVIELLRAKGYTITRVQ
jgi:uncharacterized protein YbaP (TraB family)